MQKKGPKAEPKLMPSFIRKRGGKITIDLDKANQCVNDAGDITIAFLRRLGQDGIKIAGQVEQHVRERARQAKEEVKKSRSA